jgi:hypothetical protein
MQKSARWRLQATVVKLTYQLRIQSLYLPSFGIELEQRKIQSSTASYICIKQTQNEIHLEIRIFRGLSPLLLKVRGAQAHAAPVVPTAMHLAEKLKPVPPLCLFHGRFFRHFGGTVSLSHVWESPHHEIQLFSIVVVCIMVNLQLQLLIV